MRSGAVLLVDDNAETCAALSAVLALRGCETVTIHEGAKALEYLRTNGERVSLVVLDLCMPGMDGFEFLRVKAADPVLASIPVVVFSASNGDRLPRAIPFVRKGVDPDKLLATIESAAR